MTASIGRCITASVTNSRGTLAASTRRAELYVFLLTPFAVRLRTIDCFYAGDVIGIFSTSFITFRNNRLGFVDVIIELVQLRDDLGDVVGPQFELAAAGAAVAQLLARLLLAYDGVELGGKVGDGLGPDRYGHPHSRAARHRPPSPVLVRPHEVALANPRFNSFIFGTR